MLRKSGMISILLNLVLCLAAINNSQAQATAPQNVASDQNTPDTIGDITIINQDVFDPNGSRYNHFPYTIANKLHIKTKKNVIERELLFKPGDVYDPELIAESERNLRRFSFLGTVTITPHFVDNNKVNIEVETTDQWSMKASVDFEHSGGVSNFGFHLYDVNLLGTGKSLMSRYRWSTEKNEKAFSYLDPRFWGKQWLLLGAITKTTEGETYLYQLEKPFYTLDTKWSIGNSAAHAMGLDKLYDGGTLSVEVPFSGSSGEFFLTYAWGNRKSKIKLGFGVDYFKKQFPGEMNIFSLDSKSLANLSSKGGPTERNTLKFDVTVKKEKIGFTKKTNLDKVSRVEDIFVGSVYKFAYGRAISLLDSQGGYNYFAGEYLRSLNITRNQLIVLNTGFETRVASTGFNNSLARGYFRYYNQGLPYQTIALNVSGTFGSGVDQPFQLVLGGNTGLRAYRAWQFTGQRKILINLENRAFTPIEMFTVKLGFAAFFDAGNVWREDESIDFGDLHASAGIGLRFGLTKTTQSRVVRLDVAHPLGGRGFSISVSSDQIFTVFDSGKELTSSF